MNSVSLLTNWLVLKYKDSKGRNVPSMNQSVCSNLSSHLHLNLKMTRGMVSSDNFVL